MKMCTFSSFKTRCIAYLHAHLVEFSETKAMTLVVRCTRWPCRFPTSTCEMRLSVIGCKRVIKFSETLLLETNIWGGGCFFSFFWCSEGLFVCYSGVWSWWTSSSIGGTMFEQALAVLAPVWMSYMPTHVVKWVQMG
jgi:hypothetical protein